MSAWALSAARTLIVQLFSIRLYPNFVEPSWILDNKLGIVKRKVVGANLNKSVVIDHVFTDTTNTTGMLVRNTHHSTLLSQCLYWWKTGQATNTAVGSMNTVLMLWVAAWLWSKSLIWVWDVKAVPVVQGVRRLILSKFRLKIIRKCGTSWHSKRIFDRRTHYQENQYKPNFYPTKIFAYIHH